MNKAQVKAARNVLDDISKYQAMGAYLQDSNLSFVALILGCLFWQMTGTYPQEANRDDFDPDDPAEWVEEL